jgi:hypothetical protein
MHAQSQCPWPMQGKGCPYEASVWGLHALQYSCYLFLLVLDYLLMHACPKPSQSLPKTNMY